MANIEIQPLPIKLSSQFPKLPLKMGAGITKLLLKSSSTRF